MGRRGPGRGAQQAWMAGVFLIGCGGDSALDACMDAEPTCPHGTWAVLHITSVHSTTVIAEGHVDASVPDAHGDGEVDTWSEEGCTWTCEPMVDCPEGTEPVITEDCLACIGLVDDVPTDPECVELGDTGLLFPH